MKKNIPIVSVAGLRSERLEERQYVANQLGLACRETGFFYLIDHGISSSLLDRIFDHSQNFFALPIEQKQQLSIKQSAHNRGYVAMADERLNPNAGADLKEAFNIGIDLPVSHPDVVANKPFCGVNHWPELPAWRLDMLTYFGACLALGRTVHRGLSLDLGLPEAFFEPHLKQPIATLRLLHYPLQPAQTGETENAAGEHTDYGNITLLATDGVAGLQVLNRDGQWLEAPSIAGAFVCNIGDCLMRWSNNTYISTPHRVRPPDQERFSIAFFLEVSPDAIVDPRDVFPEQQPKYPPVSCADYLASKLNATYEHRNS